MLFSRTRMFTSLPLSTSAGASPLGLSSTRIAEALNFRRNLPPIVTASHLYALLRSPTAVEREVAELARDGVLRRVVVPTSAMSGNAVGGEAGEVLILMRDLEGMIEGVSEDVLEKEAKDAFLGFLRRRPEARKLAEEEEGMRREWVDQLIRAGFLTSHVGSGVGSVTRLFARLEDRGTMLSVETVSRAATGSLEAVGGHGAVHEAGGSGGGSGRGQRAVGGELHIAVPGHGAYLKLVTAALARLADILKKTAFKEMPEDLLRERWDGGIATDEKRASAKRSRREYAGVLPARTRKWREFWGLGFEWVLHEAVGAGVVEVFEARGVGRGVRLMR